MNRSSPKTHSRSHPHLRPQLPRLQPAPMADPMAQAPSDTILALASAPGASLRAILRLSGPSTHSLLDAVAADRAPGLAAGPAVRAIRLDLGQGRTVPAIIVRWFAPRSYTGEDAAELLLPGSPPLLSLVMDRVLSFPGVRPAGPGEFTARAYLNGKLSLDQAEGVARVIASQTADQLAFAQRLLSGEAGGAYRAWAEELATLLALVEAGIDFADQDDVRPIEKPDLMRRIATLSDAIDRLPSPPGGAASGVPRVVLAGPPNAGKSTLFNALLGRDRATASPIAGATRDVLVEPAVLTATPGGRPIAFELADTAGLLGAGQDAGPGSHLGAGPHTDPHTHPHTDPHTDPNAAAQARSRNAIDAATVLVVCRSADDPTPFIDRSAGVDPVASGASGRCVIVVRTKADLVHGPVPALASGSGEIAVCALDGWNLDLLRGRLADALAEVGEGPGTLPQRHRTGLLTTRSALGEALTELEADRDAGWLGSPEVVAGHLRAGLDALGEIVGEISPDEVLGRVFASFCVGK